MPTPFTAERNAREPYRERWSYSTNILRARSDAEQRIARRQIPRRVDSFLVSALEAGPAAELQALQGRLDQLLYAGQSEQFAVPIWPDATPLLAAAAAGTDVVLSCDTVGRDFRVGGLALVSIDEGQVELCTIGAVTDTTVTVDELVSAWPAQRTSVIPARLGRLADDPVVRRPSQTTAELEVSFELEDLADPGVAAAINPRVFDVVTDPSRLLDQTDRLARSIVKLEGASTGLRLADRGITPLGERTYRLYLDTRAGVAALRRWFHGVQGQRRAFWVPTYQADFIPLGPLTAADTSLLVRASGYTSRVFPLGEGRRHLGFIDRRTGTVKHLRVTAAEDLGDGREQLTLAAALEADWAPDEVLLSLLWYVRLASDDMEIVWHGRDAVAECELAMTEIRPPASVGGGGGGGGNGEPPGSDCPHLYTESFGGPHAGDIVAVPVTYDAEDGLPPATENWTGHTTYSGGPIGVFQYVEGTDSYSLDPFPTPLTQAGGNIQFITQGLSGVPVGITAIAQKKVGGYTPGETVYLVSRQKTDGSGVTTTTTERLAVPVVADEDGFVTLTMTWTNVFGGLLMSGYRWMGGIYIDATPGCVEQAR